MPPLQQQAVSQLNTCGQTVRDKGGQNRPKNAARTALPCHTQIDEYFIVIPGKAFKRAHETTVVWSRLSGMD